MRWLLASSLCALSGMSAADEIGTGNGILSWWLDPSVVCDITTCPQFHSAGPAWTAGRMDDPHHGGFASVLSYSGEEQLFLTCESRGPMAVLLRSGSIDRGEVQVRIDGAGVEWLMLEQRAGFLVSEIPRASRLLHALQDGQEVQIVAADGRIAARFGLRGSSRAIDEAMSYCAER